jgi:type IV pilus assembly protein PilE
MKRGHRGFTIIEAMIVVAIIAILAAIALPSYRDYVLRSKLVEAMNGLAEFRVRMEQFYQDNRRYDGAGLGGCGAAAPTSKYFTFTCTPGAAPAQTYVATATGIDSEGTGGFVYTINEANARSTTINVPPAPTGWSSNATCWVRAKPNVC